MNTTLPLYHHHPYSSSYRFETSPRFYSQSSPPEDIFDDEDQIPTVEDFRAIVDDYLNNLSPKKRDKALVDQHRYCLIQQVLRDPRNTAISTAQFRFWVKKMFQLQPGTSDIVCHDSKPVAMKEQIYEILVKAHREAHHGGRDKTSALVRRKFSWIPKELVARFVRHCPFCITRRNNGHSPNSLVSKGSSTHSRYSRHAYSFDSGITSICTPSSLKENESDLSSGPPSSDSSYETTPNYVTMSSSSSPKKPYFNTMYDRDEHDFLGCTPYDTIQTSFGGQYRHDSHRPSHQSSTMHSLNHNSLPQPQSPLFYNQNYSGYSFYNTGYYPNALGISQCQENSPSSSSTASVTASNSAVAAAAAAVALMRSPVASTSDLLSHHEQAQEQRHSQSNNHFTSYQPLDISENTFGSCM